MNYLKSSLSACGMALVLLSSCGGGATTDQKAPQSKAEMKKADRSEWKSYKADVDKSEIHWLGKKVTGQHEGAMKLQAAKMQFSNGTIHEGKFVFDMKSITCTDIESQDYNDKFIDHLHSDDFFSIGEFPTAMYEVESSGRDGNGIVLNGKLHMKGKVADQEIKMTSIEEGAVVFLQGTAVVDRTAFDIRYGSGKFFENLGDRMIDDDFELTFKIVMNQK